MADELSTTLISVSVSSFIGLVMTRGFETRRTNAYIKYGNEFPRNTGGTCQRDTDQRIGTGKLAFGRLNNGTDPECCCMELILTVIEYLEVAVLVALVIDRSIAYSTQPGAGMTEQLIEMRTIRKCPV